MSAWDESVNTTICSADLVGLAVLGKHIAYPGVSERSLLCCGPAGEGAFPWVSPQGVDLFHLFGCDFDVKQGVVSSGLVPLGAGASLVVHPILPASVRLRGQLPADRAECTRRRRAGSSGAA